MIDIVIYTYDKCLSICILDCIYLFILYCTHTSSGPNDLLPAMDMANVGGPLLAVSVVKVVAQN